MTFETETPIRAIEHGHQAIAALRNVNARDLLVIRARATFRPIRDYEIAPVLPCELCLDGGLRVVGRVRGRGCWKRVHACDTCGAVQMFDLPEG